jgi:hypothetical protein
MMAANGTQALREKVLFPPNQPVRLALKYAQPKIGKSPSGDDYALFTTTDNKVFFLDCDEARVITGAGIPPGQDIDVTMRWSGKRGDPKIYGVSLPSGTAAYGAQPNGTFAVPSTQHPAPSTQARDQIGMGTADIAGIARPEAQAGAGGTRKTSGSRASRATGYRSSRAFPDQLRSTQERRRQRS